MTEKRGVRRLLAGVVAMLGMYLLGSCDSIDCTLDNEVYMYAVMYQGGKDVTLDDTLTVTGGRSGVLLLNKKVNAGRIALPVSYYWDTDTMVFTVVGDGYRLQDTVWIGKSNVPHYESPDCPNTMFHMIESVRSTHQFIDSISITKHDINYGKRENIQIHLLSAD